MSNSDWLAARGGVVGERHFPEMESARPSPDYIEPVPAASADTLPDDPRFVSIEIHTLRVNATKLEFLRLDGFWLVKASEGVNQMLEDLWREETDKLRKQEAEERDSGQIERVVAMVEAVRNCRHTDVTLSNGDNGESQGHCTACGVRMFFDQLCHNWAFYDPVVDHLVSVPGVKTHRGGGGPCVNTET